MTDVHTPEIRSFNMRRIKSRDTKPEKFLRQGLHRLGYRFRLHQRDLPGTPDLVLPKYRAAIFVHGCFWHGHSCKDFRYPSSRADFWQQKIDGNRARDVAAVGKLRESGWRILVVWECAIKSAKREAGENLLRKCSAFLRGKRTCASIS